MPKILAYAASLRKESLNKRLLALTVDIARNAGATVTVADLNDYTLPLYSQDIQDGGFSPQAEAFRDLILGHDALIIAQPEYNYSMPGAHKNLIDWMSRFRPQPYSQKHALLTSAAPSLVGGNRGLWSLRQPLEVLGMHVYPNMFSLARAGDAFNDDGTLSDAALQKRLEETVKSFLAFVDR